MMSSLIFAYFVAVITPKKLKVLDRQLLLN